ncbi:RecF/RecN/SMC [Pilobolus umbonatus]|nr:RecF/RecN/SMC [Pilobolus umbonatus]
MYIKQIIIQGFKSYKDQITIDPFSEKHNVIVGRNGTGKSNFFSAIRFVLGDAYQNLDKEERQALLHEGVGSTTISAYVEIIFDNSDNRFPTGKEEVILRRSIGVSLDEYSLDRKIATKSDIMNLLESAGFSRANPYYIVPQGRVTSLTVARDEDRLKLLKDIAGTRVYEQKRTESTTLMQETNMKKLKIDEVLNYIQERLQELEAEKAELSEYQDLDKERRSIEYTIYAREQSNANTKLEELEDEGRRHVSLGEMQREEYYKNEKAIQTLQQRLRDVKQTIKLHDTEKNDLQDERENLMKLRAQLEVMIKDLEDSQMSEDEFKQTMTAQLNEIETEITTKQSELDRTLPQYTQLTDNANAMRQELRLLQAEQQNIHFKQARLTQFNNKSERDAWLTSQIQEITQDISMRQTQLNTLEAEKKAAETELLFKDQTIKKLAEKNTDRYEMNQKIAEEEAQLRLERDEATEERKSLWRESALLDATMKNYHDEIRKAEEVLSSSINQSTSRGIAAISQITQSHNIPGVYGPLFDLFELDERFTTAVEAAAGASLFHVVVDTDNTATRLLDIMNEQKLGRVTFIPLNRIKTKQVEYPQSSDAIPLLSKLQYDPKYQKAFEEVFAGTIVCPNLEVASSYAKSHRLTVVTLDGNRVESRGALSGGYIDSRRSRLDSAKKLRSLQTKQKEDKSRGIKIKEEIAELDQKITHILSNIQVLQTKKKSMDLDDSHSLEIKLRKEEDGLKKLIQSKTKAIENTRIQGQLLEKQLIIYQAELASEPSQLLSAEEQAVLVRNKQSIEQINLKLAETTQLIMEMEAHINHLKDSLDNGLLRRRNELISRKDRVIKSGSVEDLNRRKRELRLLMKKLGGLSKQIEDLDSGVDKLEKEGQNINQELEEVMETQANLTQIMSKSEKSLDRNLLRISILNQKKEECNANIRELGVLPDEAFEKYDRYSMEKLLKRLHRANERLQKYGHVNKKAFEQYNRFTKQRDQLTQRKAELDNTGEAISKLIDSLERRKNEAIERTFGEVAGNFSKIFEILVPAGKGELIMKSDDMDMDGNSVDHYSGVSIKVSFNSKSDEGLTMQQLSGGQKSLVALALIFAIQRCDPAPFYLFDEIDANLDAQYRAAVAEMIHRMSDHAQFITTTFRPELLANADKFYGVTFQGKVSRIHPISKENALGFIEQEQTH